MRQAIAWFREQGKVEAELKRLALDNQPKNDSLPRDVNQVLDCIHAHAFDHELNVKTLKQRCGIFDNNISCRFRHVMGITLKMYIDALRMKAAAYLLENRRRLGVYDVSQWVGYENPQTFYRVFRKHLKCTPATYRSQSENGAARTRREEQ